MHTFEEQFILSCIIPDDLVINRPLLGMEFPLKTAQAGLMTPTAKAVWGSSPRDHNPLQSGFFMPAK